MKAVEDLLQFSNFQFKYAARPVKAITVIFDQRKALAPIKVEEALLKSPLIVTSNLAFLAMFQEYFDNMWNMGRYAVS
jgi:hypothetical protein